MERDDLQLIERARQGDPDAFDRFIAEYSPRVHAIAYQMTGDSEDARDITQEVFVRLLDALDSYHPGTLFLTWLYRVTVNRAIDFQRRNARHRHRPLNEMSQAEHPADTAPDPEAQVERREFKGALHKLVGKLSDQQRQVFVLRDLQGFTTEEIATMLECRTSTIRVHLARARRRIKEALAAAYPEYVAGGER